MYSISKNDDFKEININNDYFIKIKENKNFGIAGEIWNSAFLLSYLITNKRCKNLMKNKTILEIGSGTGVCGIFACLSGAKKVYLTDREENLSILRENFEININEILAKNCEVEIKSLDWNYIPDFNKIEDKIDLIIASDIIYHGMNFKKIIDLIKYFCLNKNVNKLSKISKTDQDKIKSEDDNNFSKENVEVILAFTNRLGSSFAFFDIIEDHKEEWCLKKLNYDFLNLDDDILEKIKYSELYSLKYKK